jgi:hypothetical protein
MNQGAVFSVGARSSFAGTGVGAELAGFNFGGHLLK